MAFQTVPFNVVGGTYESRSKPISDQHTVNMYITVNEKGKDPISLQSFPGQKLVSSVDGAVDRGRHNMNEVAYSVVDDTLYSINSAGVHSAVGGGLRIGGTDRCIFADDGDHLVVVADKVYVYTKSTNTLVINTNVNLVDVLSVTFIKSTFIYTTPNLSFVSQPLDPFAVDGLNAISAESNPDKLVRDYAFNQTIYRMGKRTGEPWYFSGVGKPPIDVIEGQQFSVGLGAIHTLANTDRALYWLGDDKAIYRVSGGINERVSDDGISNSIEEMTTIDDSFGYTFTLQGMDFYLITFPSENKTFLLNEKLGVNGWTELSSGDGLAYSGTSALSIYDKTYIGSGGKLLTLELNEFTQDTDTVFRRRTMLPITRKNIPSPIKGRKIQISNIEFVIEQGVGLITGQGEVPRMLLELSLDGGRSFAHSQWVELGRLGEHTLEVDADMMVVSDEITPRITVTDPVPFSISAGMVDIKAVAR
mgnify:CR=1 FL=1|tara:strand:+ start:94 stop:1518 length:1425 start_codon:yes stop_codon:yes gene_type:complete